MRTRDRHSRAFTLTELLVVIAIIVLLLSAVFVAINAASKRAQAAKTQFLMNSISAGLAQFNGDFGYLPPVLGRKDGSSGGSGFARDVVRYNDTVVGGANDIQRQQNWFSYTTIAEYLVGYGHRGEDGYGRLTPASGTGANPPAGVGDKESPRYGIRSPGPDGCWGAIDAPQGGFVNFKGYYRGRNPARIASPPGSGNPAWNTVALEGRVYGPYIDTIDDRIIGGLTGFTAQGRPQIVTADQLPPDSTVSFDQLPKCILDYWGEPIAYYRTPYAGDDLRSSVASSNGGFLNLGDIYALREWEIDTSEQSSGAADASGDNSSSASMKGAGFALLSRGGDRTADLSARRDGGEFNKDNIVQSGK